MYDSLTSVRQLIKDGNKRELLKALNVLSGFEIADLIVSAKTDTDQLFVFNLLTPTLAAQTFDYLPTRIQKKILHQLPAEKTAGMLNAMPPDDRTALLQQLPSETVECYIELLPKGEREVAETLLGYPKDSAGRIMTTDYIAVKMNWTAEMVLERVRAYGYDSETINMIYVVDDNDTLLDDIKLKEFLFVTKNTPVSQLADARFVALSVYDKATDAVNVFKQYGYDSLPVIDLDGKLMGVVTLDDIFQLASKVTTRNIQKIGGTEALDEPYMETTIFELVKKRARWLVLLFIGEMFTATAMGYFEDEIAKAVVLALFLPLIISSGGNAGSQSCTLIIRSMALGEIKFRDWYKVMRREIVTGVLLGIILGAIGFARVALWGSVSSLYGEHWLLISWTIFFSLIGVVLWGSFSGAMLPILLKRLGADPATSSTPLVATLVDVTGIVIYFMIALVILSGTLL
jgi:magnesium transporter